jgi:hypothetical protein
VGRIRELLAHGGIAVLAIVFALALAAFNLAVAISREVISVLVQHTSDDNGGGFLSFTVFETEISYGEALYYAIAIMLLAASLHGAWLLSRHTTRICPECESQVPREASVCRYCTSELAIEGSDA